MRRVRPSPHGLLKTPMEFYSRNENTTDTWLTPQWIIDALGPFDMDVATPEEGMPWATAKRMLKPSDDGLVTPWIGRVWMNPPYGKLMRPFMEKLVSHGNGIALITARTDARWFHDFVFLRSTGIFFPKGRIKFQRIDGTGGATNFASVFAAYGVENYERLCAFKMEGARYRTERTNAQALADLLA